jgi:hypothetical protein
MTESGQGDVSCNDASILLPLASDTGKVAFSLCAMRRTDRTPFYMMSDASFVPSSHVLYSIERMMLSSSKVKTKVGW